MFPRLLALALCTILLAAPSAAQDFTLQATYGDVELEEGFLPDPYDVELTAGGSVDVNVGACSYGYVANAPDVKFRYSTSGGSNLYIYGISGEDTTILINTPNGTWLCDDDSYGDGDPIVVIPNAPGGRYDIWVGTYGDDLSPATLYLSEIDPRDGDDSGDYGSNGQVPDLSLDPTFGFVELEEGFLPDPYEVELTAGGSVDVDVSGCSYGYVANAPDVKFRYSTSGGADLYIYAISGEDTTLLINTANGSWVCNDDGYGDGDPIVVIPNAPGGRYDIWVGTYGDDLAPASLYISEIDPR